MFFADDWVAAVAISSAFMPSSPVTMGFAVLLMQSTKCCSSALRGSWNARRGCMVWFFSSIVRS